MSKEKKKFDLELFFRALADNTRLRLLNLMGKDEICVCFLVDVIGTNQPKISRHLAYLKRAGIVSSRRDGKWIHYKIAMPSNDSAAKILQNLLDGLALDPQMQAEKNQLASICCQLESFRKPINIVRAEPPIYLLD
jgi:ArsR family transcriptional regulator